MPKILMFEDDLPEDEPPRRRTDVEIAEDLLEAARQAQQDEFREYGSDRPVPHIS